MVYNNLFYIFCVLLILSSGLAIFSKNILHSVAFAFCASICSSFIFVLMNAGLIAVILVIVYSGTLGIILFFIYAFRAKNRDISDEFNIQETCLAVGSCILFLVEIVIILCIAVFQQKKSTIAIIKNTSITGLDTTIEKISFILFGKYGYALELCGIILLIGIVGNILLIYGNELGSTLKIKHKMRNKKNSVKLAYVKKGEGVNVVNR